MGGTVEAIARREGWKCFRCNRGPFHVIEVWLENQLMVEILPPEFAAEYLAVATSATSRHRPASPLGGNRAVFLSPGFPLQFPCDADLIPLLGGKIPPLRRAGNLPRKYLK